MRSVLRQLASKARCLAHGQPDNGAPVLAQRFSLLGSTGSIGTQTLDIVREQPEKFEIVALAAGGNLDLLADQARGGGRPLAQIASLLFSDTAPTMFRTMPRTLHAILMSTLAGASSPAYSAAWPCDLCLHTFVAQLRHSTVPPSERCCGESRAQVKEFQPSLVAIRDGSRVAELRELLKDAAVQPEIVCGDAGACEVAAHLDADAVVTGARPCAYCFTSNSKTRHKWLDLPYKIDGNELIGSCQCSRESPRAFADGLSTCVPRVSRHLVDARALSISRTGGSA